MDGLVVVGTGLGLECSSVEVETDIVVVRGEDGGEVVVVETE